MARRSPAQVRADHIRRGDERLPDGLSARGRAWLTRLEHTRLWPGAAAATLSAWEQFVRDPVHRLWEPGGGCGEPMCCPDPEELRRVLDLVAHNLPPEDARRFRRRVAEIDDLW